MMRYAYFYLDKITKISKRNRSFEGRKVAAKIETLLWKGADYYTKGVQTITFARLQDNLKKRWLWHKLRSTDNEKHGITSEEFFSKT